jgi:hypothetical protein
MKPAGAEYLVVDEFLRTLIEARALETAMELGLVERLLAGPGMGIDEVGRAQAGVQFLLQLLRAGGVVQQRGDRLQLTGRFQMALRYRDLLEAKLEFARIVTADLLERFPDLVVDPDRFMRNSRLLELFDYSRCFEPTEQNLRHTRRWMRLTTALTRYEAGVMLGLHDFSSHVRMLDIGGNSGELALRICQAHPGIRATVADLPVVCRIGQEHVREHLESGRIAFHPGDALADQLPGGFDIVTFKSILHDWPEEAARRFLGRAGECLAPGGMVLIFERGPIVIGEAPPPYSLLPILLFFRSFRGPALYVQCLEELGYLEVQVRPVQLETPFFMVAGRKRG